MDDYTLITGATSGIGLELSNCCASHGQNLVLIGRNNSKLEIIKEQLKQKYSVKIVIIESNLTDLSSPNMIYQKLKENSITVDILINNAGFGKYGSYVDYKWSTDIDMITVNIIALTQLTKLLLPNMIANKRGKILNVSSTAGFRPGPLMAVYFATKAFVLSFSEALAEEVHGTGVTVTTLCPGATNTNFMVTAGLQKNQHIRFKRIATAEDVANFGYKSMMRGDGVVVYGIVNRLLLLIQRFTPRKFVVVISRFIKEKKNH